MSTAELLGKQEYKYGFVTDIESDMIPRGLSEDTIRLISEKKNEPEWMLEFRLKAYRHWLTMKEPKHWPHLTYPEIDYQDVILPGHGVGIPRPARAGAEICIAV